ncbi:hypothetical protein FA15DRAFT_761123 [Coprinopsis marcescibilis]|uniref:Uncharacterized protein n=1 Tax=Coprinopsis marcescibilis TaxID=230819 RepID=A0A5C3KB41_COPMA|nr:hypothetical protein FA15DRAFT_761123 [Coprinopsis marcescibilis]
MSSPIVYPQRSAPPLSVIFPLSISVVFSLSDGFLLACGIPFDAPEVVPPPRVHARHCSAVIHGMLSAIARVLRALMSLIAYIVEPSIETRDSAGGVERGDEASIGFELETLGITLVSPTPALPTPVVQRSPFLRSSKLRATKNHELGRLLACQGRIDEAREQFDLVLSGKYLKVGPSGWRGKYTLENALHVRTHAANQALAQTPEGLAQTSEYVSTLRGPQELQTAGE